MKMINVTGLLIAALFVSGCANTAYYEALKERAKSDGLIQIAKAEAEAEKWKALSKASDTDAGKFALGLVAAVSEAKNSGQATVHAEPIRAPRDFLDYFGALTGGTAALVNAWSGIENIRAYKQVRTAEINGNVALETARQTGETNRVTANGTSNLQIATTLSTNLRPLPSSVTNITAGGSVNTGTSTTNSTTTNNSTSNTTTTTNTNSGNTTTTTTRTCQGGTAGNGGAGAPGGNSTTTTGSGAAGSSGATGSGGSANGGQC